jgi:hypothetical protein
MCAKHRGECTVDDSLVTVQDNPYGPDDARGGGMGCGLFFFLFSFLLLAFVGAILGHC